MTIGNLNTVHCFFPDIFADFLLDDLLANRRQRIAHKDTQTVLMAVQRVHSHLLGLSGHLQTRHIVVSIKWQLQLTGLTATDIKTPDSHL